MRKKYSRSAEKGGIKKGKNQVVFDTPKDSFMIALYNEFEGVLLETPEKPETPEKSDPAYYPMLPAVRMIPIRIRFVADQANKARWRIQKIPKSRAAVQE